jgi:hypothetical protein
MAFTLLSVFPSASVEFLDAKIANSVFRVMEYDAPFAFSTSAMFSFLAKSVPDEQSINQ